MEKKINLSRKPFRGIISEIAKAEGTSTQNIYHAINIAKNPRILKIVADKAEERIRERDQAIQRLFEISQAVGNVANA